MAIPARGPTLGNVDTSIDPTRDQVRRLRDAGRDGPVVMLNLLKFRAVANYPAELNQPPCSGEPVRRKRIGTRC